MFGTDLKGNFVYFNNGLVDVTEENEQMMRNYFNSLGKKEQLLKAKGMAMINKATKSVMSYFNATYAQHFYPLSIIDYASSIQDLMLKKIPSLPILSVDSHDFGPCDFQCRDCLAEDTRLWGKRVLGFNSFEPGHYQKVLKGISLYSYERGCNSVRLEFSGEGNPDLYPHRARIIRYAREKCNMGIVYISSGSKLNPDTIDALAEHAKFIRISLPGLGNHAYAKYSRQKNRNDYFTYDDALRVIESLVNKRAKLGRDGELLIGARTCIRPENEGHYLNTAKKIKNIGGDSFEVVKIISPEDTNIEDHPVPPGTVDGLNQLKKVDLLRISVPSELDYIYYNRVIDDTMKPEKCYSSLVSPILYGPHLVICTHWEKIKDPIHSHYGILTGKEGELDNLISGERGHQIRERVPGQCSSCAAINDNLLMASIEKQLVTANSPSDVDFYLMYSLEELTSKMYIRLGAVENVSAI